MDINGYQWILMQCKEVNYLKPNFNIVDDEKGIKRTSSIIAELQQHNFEQWLHLKLEINRIFKEAKSQSQQGEEKIGNDE